MISFWKTFPSHWTYNLMLDHFNVSCPCQNPFHAKCPNTSMSDFYTKKIFEANKKYAKYVYFTSQFWICVSYKMFWNSILIHIYPIKLFFIEIDIFYFLYNVITNIYLNIVKLEHIPSQWELSNNDRKFKTSFEFKKVRRAGLCPKL